MKNILVTVFVALCASFIATGQQIKDKSTETVTKEVMQDGKKVFEYKVITEEIKNLQFKKEDANDTNQELDLDGSPTKIIKTVWIDKDVDGVYDKKITLTYNSEYDADMEFETIADGIVFTNHQGQTQMITDLGFYVMNASQDDEVYINVDTTSVTY
ncbi:hypothetical protein [Nonlabens agnitus]|uniref:Uncharacterized protein n=1 Tax=Nonlabens agnitus TaxID=870484 RepID=A0A2S9WWX3_9FLAO|nr:hypothetical protein [Nonlabens agnitus]PRP67970.1 hypothetical protein BST86_13160 [Nonlabens agnitus]